MTLLTPLMRWWAIDPTDPALDALEATIVDRGIASGLGELYDVLGSATATELASIERTVLNAFGADGGWRRYPDLWVRERLGDWPWSKQAEVLRALATHRKVAVHSGHGIGKSRLASWAVAWMLSVFDDALALTCYTDDHEVLTRAGWKRFRDVEAGPDGDEFATRNQETKRFEWQQATRYYEAPWDGEVVDLINRGTNLRVTPNHRVLVRWRDQHREGERLKPAEEITQRGAEIPATSEWVGQSPPSVRFGRYEWDSVTFASFLGAWLAEGSLGGAMPYQRKPDREYVWTTKRPWAPNPAHPLGAGGPIDLTQLEGTKGFEPYRELLIRMLGREPFRSSGKTWRFNCADLWHYLTVLGKAGDKFIPEEVKNWGRPELEALLHHYLLGDGWQTKLSDRAKTQQWRATTVSRRLADDLQEIAQKVGLSATIKKRPPRGGGTFNGGRRILAENCRPCYEIHFNVSECRSVKPSRSHYEGTVYCVSVPNEVLYVRRAGIPSWCGNTAPTGAQVRSILWREIRSAHRRGRLAGRTNQIEWINDRGDIIGMGRKPSDTDEHAFQGLHALNALVVLDEAGGVPEALFEDAEKIVTTPGSRILAVGNPTHEGSYWHKVCSGRIPDWHVIHVSSTETPNFNDEGDHTPPDVLARVTSQLWVDEQRRRYGETSVRYRQQVLGQFTRERAMTVIPVQWAQAAVHSSESERPVQHGVVRLGVDVGATGDWFVVRAMLGNRVGPIWRDTSGSAGGQADTVVRAAAQVGASEVIIDVAGIGYGLPDLIRERNPNLLVVPVDAAEKSCVVRLPDGRTVYRWAIPSGIKPELVRDEFANRRAELWWAGRERCMLAADPTYRPVVPYVTEPWDLTALEDQSLIDAWLGEGEDDPTMEELTAPGYEHKPRALGEVILIESKDELRKASRLGKSTDHSDALLLAAFPHPSREILPLRSSSPQRRARRPDFKPTSYRPTR